MSDKIVNCPDCAIAMEIGCLPEVGDNNSIGWTTFLPGIPQDYRFLGLIKTGSIVVDWKKAIPVTAFRCPECGLVKSYALQPPTAPPPTPPTKESNKDFPPGADDDRYRLGDA